jgi:argininosuccinate lyase
MMPMENTGRIQQLLTPTARRILFGKTADESIDSDLGICTRIDKAHLIMLVESGIVSREIAGKLLKIIDELSKSDFAALRGREAPRGLYLLYEDYLIERLGPRIGGIIQIGRSRNDLNATMFRIRLRQPYLRLLSESLRLQAVLLRRAHKYSRVVMPAYTHYQAAVPITYGHYNAGLAGALERDISGLFEAGAGLGYCPLGAGAVGGTALPIDQARTSALLGFVGPVRHSVDAVASRDLVMRLSACAAILGITLSRLTADLLLWTTSEFGFITLPDNLVGSSSMMPQKRNPFVLEHVQGRTTSALGAFVAAATAMHAKPFTNSISVGTEAVNHVFAALKSITEATTLARLMVAGAQPQPEHMLRKAINGFTSATEMANRLATYGDMSFREAHHAVGNYIREAIEGNNLPESVSRQMPGDYNDRVPLKELDPTSVAISSVYGGGPGPESLLPYIHDTSAKWAYHMGLKRELARRWSAADSALEDTARNLCRDGPSDLTARI